MSERSIQLLFEYISEAIGNIRDFTKDISFEGYSDAKNALQRFCNI
jgi:uncharacterized protein with HEPN domain